MIASWGRPEDCEAASHLKALGALMPTPPPGAPGPFALSDEAKLKALASEADLTPIAVTDVYPDLDTALRAGGRSAARKVRNYGGRANRWRHN